jgi:hypothetical protein
LGERKIKLNGYFEGIGNMLFEYDDQGARERIKMDYAKPV